MKNWTLPSIMFWWITSAVAAAPPLDETPPGAEDWGYRPQSGAVLEATPPGFSWRPQAGIVSWELQCGRGEDVEAIEYRVADVAMNVHRPPRILSPGTYTWRYRGVDPQGNHTKWSRTRTFRIALDAVSLPMPPRAELLARIPKSHPRLFVRPEDMPRLRELAQGPMRERFGGLVAQSEKLLANPPPTTEPKKYPADMVRGSKEWKSLWWGNRTYTIAALDGAATLAFTRLLGGKEEYGQLARRILLDCATWDP